MHTVYGMQICIDDLTNAEAQFNGFLIPPVNADKQHAFRVWNKSKPIVSSRFNQKASERCVWLMAIVLSGLVGVEARIDVSCWKADKEDTRGLTLHCISI